MLNDLGDSKVTVKKSELIAAIRTNRDEHRSSFLEAHQGYRNELIKALDRVLTATAAGHAIDLQPITSLTQPAEHTREYDRILRMLEMSTADEIAITESQFAQYVLDDWGWKAAFIATSSRYK